MILKGSVSVLEPEMVTSTRVSLTATAAIGANPKGVRLAERGGLGKIELRGDGNERAFLSAVGRTLDLVLPAEANTVTNKGHITALWEGPDRWLLTCPEGDSPGIMITLKEALGEVHAALTDVGHGRVALRLAGPSARDVLVKGTPLDIHRRVFTTGACAQTLVAKAAVLIHCQQDGPKLGPVFDLYVGRSFAPYLWSWLIDAAREFGVQVDSTG